MLLKSKPVRYGFSRQLIHNIRDALSSFPGRCSIRKSQGILIVEHDDPMVLERLLHVFGLTSLTEVTSFEGADLRTIVENGRSYFLPLVEGRRFAVRCHRVGHHPYTSIDVARQLGAELAKAATVNLDHPDVECKLEIRDNEVSFTKDRRVAAGGMPIGSQGQALCLISGGIDSPVAAWYALRRGVKVHYLFCCLGGPYQKWGPMATAKYLADHWSFGYQPQLFLVDFVELLTAIRTQDNRYRNVLLKRYFYRAADQIAEMIHADAIVTGESLGQVSSQTLSNLRTIDSVIDRIVLRPLITMDKVEIMHKAREIGTLDISEKVPEFCNVVVHKPRTRSIEADIIPMEEEIDVGILDRAVRQFQRYDLRNMAPPEPLTDFHVEVKPSGARMIWIYSSTENEPPPPEADWIIDQTELHQSLKKMTWTGMIVVGCAKGILSKDIVAILRNAGHDAYYLRKM